MGHPLVLRRKLWYRFLGSRCPDCNYTYLPPRLYCERCFAELKDWVEVGPRGTVEAVTVAHLGLDGEPLAQPETFALIRLDGADGLLLHRVKAAAGEELEVGATVEPVFLAKAARKGSILDVQHFRPARTARR
jgi:uncharacterized OB-fold protein